MNKNNASTTSYMKVAFVSVMALFGAIFALTPASVQAQYYPYNTGYAYQTNYVNYGGTNYYPTGTQSGYYVSGYAYQAPYYSPLVVSCNATTNYASIGTGVTWVANVSGGNGYYEYSWGGTDGLYGSQSTAYTNYNFPGTKTATVYVTSAGQQRSVQCSNTVTVGAPANIVYNNIYQVPPTPVYNTIYQNPVAVNQGIQIACFADTVSTKVGVPVTWAVEATGAGENFTYAWTGSDGLSGNQASVITTYTSTGLKSAVVTATSASGKSQSKACGNTVTVNSAYTPTSVAKAPTKPAAPVVVAPAVPNNNLSAAALFSLQYVPWGLVAVLVIIILFITVLYLIFNRKKI